MQQERLGNQFSGLQITVGRTEVTRSMGVVFTLWVFFGTFACSFPESRVNGQNGSENIVIASNKSLPISSPTAAPLQTTAFDCADVDSYNLEFVDNKNQESDATSTQKFIKVVMKETVISKIDVPSSSEVKNFLVRSVEKEKGGFVIVSDWGGWENHYYLQYHFQCKETKFFFVRLKVRRITGKDPGDPNNWEEFTKNLQPTIPIDKFSILDYLGNE